MDVARRSRRHAILNRFEQFQYCFHTLYTKIALSGFDNTPGHTPYTRFDPIHLDNDLLDTRYNLVDHTNLDTYDKIVFDDVRSNVILTAILAYKASEEEELVSREKRVMPISPRTGRKMDWPSVRKPNRDGTNPR